jgi:hypothetical protein
MANDDKGLPRAAPKKPSRDNERTVVLKLPLLLPNSPSPLPVPDASVPQT